MMIDNKKKKMKNYEMRELLDDSVDLRGEPQ